MYSVKGHKLDQRVLKLKTVKECEGFAENARRLNRHDLVLDAGQRAIDIQVEAQGTPTEAERDAWKAVFAYEAVLEQLHGRKVRASYTRRAIAKHGVIQAIERIVLKGSKDTKGFALLEEAGLLDYSFEAIVVKHTDVFCPAAVDLARRRLNGECV